MPELTPKQQRWLTLWPAGSIALLATVQLLLTIAIVGLEATSMVFDFYHSMIFAGFYCSLFFTITWISMYTVTCCNRYSLCCASHVLVENILSIIAAAVLLHFDNLFLQNPYTCLYGSASDCNQYSLNYQNSYSIYNSANYTVKLACIKAQLACAAVMLVINVIYLIIFIVVAIKTRNESSEVRRREYSVPPVHGLVQPVGYGTQPAQSSQDRTLQCPKCYTLIQIAPYVKIDEMERF